MNATHGVTHQYDDLGKEYMNNMGQHVPQVWARATIAKFLGPLNGKVVIDAGCGNGPDAKKLVEQGAARVLGFDPSQLMLDDGLATIALPNIDLQKGTFENIPFPDACADVLIGFFSIHYSADLDVAYAEVNRVVKSGGKIAFVAQHPAFATQQKKSELKGQEIAAFLIFNGTVTVHQPTHTMSEYLSAYFLSHFTLDHIEELHRRNDDGQELKDPILFVYTATKK